MQAVPEDPSIEVASVRWERVQLILEAQRAAQGPRSTRQPCGSCPDGGGEDMPPTAGDRRRATA